jgi:hypothetical protein
VIEGWMSSSFCNWRGFTPSRWRSSSSRNRTLRVSVHTFAYAWKRHYEAVVGVRQIHRQVMCLPLHTSNDYQRFAEVGTIFEDSPIGLEKRLARRAIPG